MLQIEHIFVHCALRINRPTTNPPGGEKKQLRENKAGSYIGSKENICFPKQFLHYSGNHRLKCYLLIIQISESISLHFPPFSCFRTLPLSSTPPYCPLCCWSTLKYCLGGHLFLNYPFSLSKILMLFQLHPFFLFNFISSCFYSLSSFSSSFLLSFCELEMKSLPLSILSMVRYRDAFNPNVLKQCSHGVHSPLNYVYHCD